MQFPGSDGEAVSVADVRRLVVAARLSKGVASRRRRSTGSAISTMIALPQERRLAATIIGSMRV